MLVSEKLTQEELDLRIENFDASLDESLKDYISKIIRYETDHYVVNDPQKDDPIIIPDETISDNIDFFVTTYKEVIDLPYLKMNSYLRKVLSTRKLLKNNALMLYARKEFAKVDLNMKDDGESYFDLDYDSGDILDFGKIEKDEKANDVNIMKTDGARLLVEYLIKYRYGGIEMSQIELIIEQLEYDIQKLSEGNDINKNKNIKDIYNSMEVIKTIGKIDAGQNYIDTDWYRYFVSAMTYDKRAYKLLKEIVNDPNKAKFLIEKIFGPEMIAYFVARYKKFVDYAAAPSDVFIASASTLMFYALAKKIKSCMKSTDCKSLTYRGFIIHYMLDELSDNEIQAMTNMFKDVFDLYLANDSLTKILKKNDFYEIMIKAPKVAQ